jgi:hypothetical protein
MPLLLSLSCGSEWCVHVILPLLLKSSSHNALSSLLAINCGAPVWLLLGTWRTSCCLCSYTYRHIILHIPTCKLTFLNNFATILFNQYILFLWRNILYVFVKLCCVMYSAHAMIHNTKSFTFINLSFYNPSIHIKSFVTMRFITVIKQFWINIQTVKS